MSFKNFNKYNEDQVILTSGRLIFNSKKDNLFLLSKKDICLSSAGDVHINVGDGSKERIFIVNSPIMQFGLGDTNNQVEPIAKGEQSVKILDDFLTDLSNFMGTLISAKGLVTGGTAELTSINIAATNMVEKINKIKSQLPKIKSNTTFSS